MTKEMIKERIGDGLEKAKEFAKDHKQDILAFGGGAAIALICVRKIEKNAFKRGYGEALKNTAYLRHLGRKIDNMVPESMDSFNVTEFTATAMGNRVSNLESVSKYLVDPEISKDITGIVVVTKA